MDVEHVGFSIRRYGGASDGARGASAAHGAQRARDARGWASDGDGDVAGGRHARDADTNAAWHETVAKKVPEDADATRAADLRGRLHASRQRERTYVYRKILNLVDRLWKRSEGVHMPILLLGWGAGRNARWSGRAPPSHWQLAKTLAQRGVLVVGVDEYHTSQVCEPGSAFVCGGWARQGGRGAVDGAWW